MPHSGLPSFLAAAGSSALMVLASETLLWVDAPAVARASAVAS